MSAGEAESADGESGGEVVPERQVVSAAGCADFLLAVCEGRW